MTSRVRFWIGGAAQSHSLANAASSCAIEYGQAGGRQWMVRRDDLFRSVLHKTAIEKMAPHRIASKSDQRLCRAMVRPYDERPDW